MTRSTLMLSTSILFSATISGTPAARMWSMASLVWGMTPSFAATTRMAMSVACAPRARMAGERLVPRRVEEGDRLPARYRLVGADVLRDAPRLVRGHAGPADGVEQRRLAWSTCPSTATIGARGVSVSSASALREEVVLRRRRPRLFDDIGQALDGVEAQIHRDDGRRVVVDRLGDLRHDAVGHQGLDHADRRSIEQGREFHHRQGAGDLHLSGGIGSHGVVSPALA